MSPKSSLATLFARYEPTNDSYVLSNGIKGKRDVVIYKDREATQPMGRFPWHYTGNPTKASKSCMLNCCEWRLEWMEDLK